MSATSVLVGAVASHVFNRQENMEDSDGAPYLPPVCSLPVLRLLQPMLDGEEDPLDADLGRMLEPFPCLDLYFLNWYLFVFTH